jgi:hypothetical protein
MNVYSKIEGGKRYVSTKLYGSTSQTTAIFTDYFLIGVSFILTIGKTDSLVPASCDR